MSVSSVTRAPAVARPRSSLRHRLAERGLDRTVLLVVPALTVLALLFVYPFIYGVQLSLQPTDGGGMFAEYRDFFADSYQRGSLIISLKLGLPGALLSVLFAVPVAYRMRGRVRGKQGLTILLLLPITFGTVLMAQGLLTLLGPTGWVNRALTGIGLFDEPVRFTYSYWGVLIAEVLGCFPFSFLLLLGYVSGIDPSLERAAATLGAGARERFRHIMLPLLAPGLAMTFCLAFVLAFSVFPSAVLIGQPAGATHVITVAAYRAAFEKFDYAQASAIAMIMATVELLVVAIVLTLRGRLYRGPTGGGKG
jgi:putative spermidine/putrescine transport system permease protein